MQYLCPAVERWTAAGDAGTRGEPGPHPPPAADGPVVHQVVLSVQEVLTHFIMYIII